MNTTQITLIAAGAALTASSLAHAHSSAGGGLYHYLSSPDHLITFGVLGVAALALAVRILHKPNVSARPDKR